MESSITNRAKAEELHQNIIMYGSLAAQNIFEMAKAIKEMRDSELYKELGYASFKLYSEEKLGISEPQAYRYISIAKNIEPSFENVPTLGGIGFSKLSLLASVSGEEQKEIAERVNLQDVTYKELKAEIQQLKEEKQQQAEQISELESEKEEIQTELEEALSRPVDVAVIEDPKVEEKYIRMMNESAKISRQQMAKIQDEHIIQNREREQKHRAEMEQLKQEYESKLVQATRKSAKSSDNSKLAIEQIEFSIEQIKVFADIVKRTSASIKNTNLSYISDMVDDIISASNDILEEIKGEM